ncbi:Ig-like domain-containing protein [Flagellimonas sp.]|uniref:Ig-like domain-containing protein n=1 Tax=Flagellimonas sp. TaxID=2058762 RepID=UPI003BA93E64|tara:strand:+ start:96923 stop:97933 length:1011 start_codon:yes stop_codon:yes gene_type:complete
MKKIEISHLSIVLSLFGGMLITPVGLNAQKAAPVAMDDTYNAGLNSTLNILASTGLLNNDSDANGNGTMSVQTTPVVEVSSGVLNLNSDGSFDYTPNPGFVGSDSFTYRVCDNGSPSEVISRFDFDTPTITTATIGPDATSVNPNAAQTGCGIHFPTGSGGSTGFDIVVPNSSGIFDFTSFAVSFEYQDQESQADIVTAGNFRIYHFRPNEMGLEIDVINSVTGLTETFTQDFGNFLSGNNPYTVAYDETTGEVTYTANGSSTVYAVAPPNSPLDSSLATDIVIGERMDGSGSSSPSLCSMEFVDNSVLCDEADVTLSVLATIITNRKITYRVNSN